MADPFPGCASGPNGNNLKAIPRQVSGVVRGIQESGMSEWTFLLGNLDAASHSTNPSSNSAGSVLPHLGFWSTLKC